MSTPDKRGYSYLLTYTTKPQTEGESVQPLKPEETFADAKEEDINHADIQQVVAFTQPRELNPELSQAVYYDSDKLKITADSLRQYLNEFLFGKFPGTGNHNIQSARDAVVREVCHFFSDLVKLGKTDPAVNKLNPADYKEWQVAQVVRAIQKSKFKTSEELKEPIVPVDTKHEKSPYFYEEVPHEKVVNLAFFTLKMHLLNSLLK